MYDDGYEYYDQDFSTPYFEDSGSDPYAGGGGGGDWTEEDYQWGDSLDWYYGPEGGGGYEYGGGFYSDPTDINLTEDDFYAPPTFDTMPAGYDENGLPLPGGILDEGDFWSTPLPGTTQPRPPSTGAPGGFGGSGSGISLGGNPRPGSSTGTQPRPGSLPGPLPYYPASQTAGGLLNGAGGLILLALLALKFLK